jgi:hypothetical protein
MPDIQAYIVYPTSVLRGSARRPLLLYQLFIYGPFTSAVSILSLYMLLQPAVRWQCKTVGTRTCNNVW